MIANLPIELDKVFIALWPDGQAFSTASILGIIVLTGMDITTDVLLIDRIMKYRDKGISRDEAMAAVGCAENRTRLLSAVGGQGNRVRHFLHESTGRFEICEGRLPCSASPL